MDKNQLKVNSNDNPSGFDGLPDIQIFDPPMCCSTGLCGPTIDQTLLDVGEIIVKLQSGGYKVERYQMSTHPNAFLSNPDVMKLIREDQMEALPIIVIRGQLLRKGSYPKLDEIQNKLNGGE